MKKFLQFNITGGTGSKAIMGMENITNIVIGSGTTLLVYYAGQTSYRTVITFAYSDTTYAPHYAVMQAINDAMVGASQPGGIYTVPTLPLKPSSTTEYNTISTVSYTNA